jgi:hypothetical protein
MKTIRIPVKREDLRSFRDAKLTNYVCNVLLSDYPAGELPFKNNPRSHGEGVNPSSIKAIKKHIRRTIEDTPESFRLVNRGGLLICGPGSAYDHENEVLILYLPDCDETTDDVGDLIRPIDGLADGGTTDDAIREFKGEYPDHPSLSIAKIRLEILARHESKDNELIETIRAICEGRNTSVAVKKWTLEAYKNEYNWLFEILEQQFQGIVAGDEYAVQDVSVQDVLQWLSLLTPGKEKNPTSVWNTKGTITTYYSKKENKDAFRSLGWLVPDYLLLKDTIVETGHDRYHEYTKNKTNRGKSLVSVKSKEGKERDDLFGKLKNPETLPFLKKKQKYKFPEAILFPLLFGFRALIGDGKWKTNPFQFWDEHGGELLEMVVDHFRTQHQNNVHSFGRDKTIFGALCDRIQRKLLEQELARLRRND